MKDLVGSKLSFSLSLSLSLSLPLIPKPTHSHAQPQAAVGSSSSRSQTRWSRQTGGTRAERVRPVSHSSCISLKYVGWTSYFCRLRTTNQTQTHQPTPLFLHLPTNLPTHTIAKNTWCIRHTRFYLGVNSDNGISLTIFSASDCYQNGTMRT